MADGDGTSKSTTSNAMQTTAPRCLDQAPERLNAIQTRVIGIIASVLVAISTLKCGAWVACRVGVGGGYRYRMGPVARRPHSFRGQRGGLATGGSGANIRYDNLHECRRPHGTHYHCSHHARTTAHTRAITRARTPDKKRSYERNAVRAADTMDGGCEAKTKGETIEQRMDGRAAESPRPDPLHLPTPDGLTAASPPAAAAAPPPPPARTPAAPG